MDAFLEMGSPRDSPVTLRRSTMALSIAHAHTTWSYDGTLTLDDWRELARRHSIDAVLFADHEQDGWSPTRYAEYTAACAAASTSDVRLIPGIEFDQEGYHLLCYGLREWPTRPSTPHALADAAHEQGCLLCLAHPGRYSWTYPQMILDAVDAVEVWNSSWVADGLVGPHPRSLAMARGRAMIVGQDVHKRKHLSKVYLETPTHDVIADLRGGRYRFVFANRCWKPEQLCQRRIAAATQRVRTPLLRRALHEYRRAHQVMHRTRARQAVWDLAIRVARHSLSAE